MKHTTNFFSFVAVKETEQWRWFLVHRRTYKSQTDNLLWVEFLKFKRKLLQRIFKFQETVAFGLIHILDSICDLDSDELINFSFKTLGKLLDASAKDKFPQRKNPCLLLLNKMKTSKDPSQSFHNLHFVNTRKDKNVLKYSLKMR